MNDVSQALRESTERLRLCAARMKAGRLGLPNPGALCRVKYLAILSVIDPSAWVTSVISHQQGELLLLVYVNTQPAPHPKGPLVDPVELVFMGRGGALVTTGTRAAGDVLDPYEYEVL